MPWCSRTCLCPYLLRCGRLDGGSPPEWALPSCRPSRLTDSAPASGHPYAAGVSACAAGMGGCAAGVGACAPSEGT
eukprot:358672-Chlamydomonas_euryale.AAC.1